MAIYNNHLLFLKRRLWKNHISGYLDGLGDAVEQGLVKAVGVSNYSGTNLSFYLIMVSCSKHVLYLFILFLLYFK